MALNKQRILSELGSVMNQLQSADCGCMGKLFSNPGQEAPSAGHPLPTCGGCRRGWCHGHGAPCAGEPYSNAGGMGMPCMGHNPPKLYADTYNYSNQNQMQPGMKDMQHNLNAQPPGNIMGNNPMDNQMGFPPGGAGNPMMQGNMAPRAGNNQMPGQGMGSQIVNMMMGGGGSRPQNMPEPRSRLTEPMLIDAPHSPHGKVGVTPLSPTMGATARHYGAGGNMGMGSMRQGGPAGTMGMGSMGRRGPAGTMGMGAVGQGDPNGNVGIASMGQGGPNLNQNNMGMNNMSQSNFMNPTTQYVTQENAHILPNPQGNPTPNQNQIMPGQNQQMMGGHGQPMMGGTGQQMMGGRSQNVYGQHTQGITKFNEMFPGVMQGGELGFDPMAIAIQMNPANQQRAAMDAMQKLMSNNRTGMIPTDQAGNQQMLGQQPPANANAGAVPQQNQQQALGHQQISGISQPNQQQAMGQQQVSNPNTGVVPQPNQQQAYTAFTGAPGHNQQYIPSNQIQSEQEYQQIQQQQINPNTGAVVASPNTGGYDEMLSDPNSQQPPSSEAVPPPQAMVKEPIFPADTSRNHTALYAQPQKNYHFNTLGQPVEMLPGNTYHTIDPGLPQTLSPSPLPMKPRIDAGRLGVKSTISKTSLMGNRSVGKTPSRNQLQQIYQQYKGSQSYTQQNVRDPGQGGTHSDGRLNTTPASHVPPQIQIPVEKVGGDTIANNQTMNKIDNVMGQLGDVPANKPQGDAAMEKVAPMRQTKTRNGLQDMVYTSYPTNAAWSFHGDFYPTPGVTGYRSRR